MALSDIDDRHHFIAVAFAGGSAARHDLVEYFELIIGQLDVDRGDVVLEILWMLGAR